MKSSTVLSLGASVLGLALCCGGGSCTGGCAGLGAGVGIGGLGTAGAHKVEEKLNEPEDPCLDNLDPHPYIPNVLHSAPSEVELKMCREFKQHISEVLSK